MNFQDFGQFERVAGPADNPHQVAFFATAKGQDFYDLVADNPAGDAFFLVDAEGLVAAASSDISALSPDGMRLIAAIGAGALLAAHVAGQRLRWDGKAIAAHVPPLAERVAAAEVAIATRHAAYLLALTGYETTEERDTWDQKYSASLALLADTASAAQRAMLGAEAEAREMIPEDLAQLVIARAEAYLAAVGDAAARKARAKARVLALPEAELTPNAVQGILDAVFAPQQQES